MIPRNNNSLEKRRDSSGRHAVVVVVVNVKRDFTVATSQRDVLVFSEERCCRSHGHHTASHVVLVRQSISSLVCVSRKEDLNAVSTIQKQ